MHGTVLVVCCHPNPTSLAHAVLEQVVAGLQSAGARPDVLDLHADGFDPVLRVDETHRRRDLDKVEATRDHRQRLAACSAVVFVYPVWWGGMPAMLKGFVDRVFVSGLAYSFEGRPKGAVFPRGLMHGREAWCIYTLDSPWLVAWLDPGWWSLFWTVFKYCGFSRVRRTFLHRLKVTSDEERRAFLARVKNRAARLGQRHAGSR